MSSKTNDCPDLVPGFLLRARILREFFNAIAVWSRDDIGADEAVGDRPQK
jgi:hypothetical protein